jgi:hypothetical protein
MRQILRAGPVCGDREQGGAIVPAEHAGECPAIELDPIQHLTALADAHTATIADIGVPGGSVAVEADAVR